MMRYLHISTEGTGKIRRTDGHVIVRHAKLIYCCKTFPFLIGGDNAAIMKLRYRMHPLRIGQPNAATHDEMLAVLTTFESELTVDEFMLSDGEEKRHKIKGLAISLSAWEE